MSAGERFANKVRAYHTAFVGLQPEQLAAMRAALADFQEECDARPDQTTFDAKDSTGRVQAFREGKRQAYLYLERLLGLDPEAIRREAERLDREEEEAMENRIESEVRRRLMYAA